MDAATKNDATALTLLRVAPPQRPCAQRSMLQALGA
jgi:hypothetical protein